MYLVNPGTNLRISSNVVMSAKKERICLFTFPLVALLYVSESALKCFVSPSVNSILFYLKLLVTFKASHMLSESFMSCHNSTG